MSKKSVYHSFIGMLALMLAFMLIINLLIPIRRDVLLSFYYIDLIVRFIFLADYLSRLILSMNKLRFIRQNILDLFSILSLQIYLSIIALCRLEILLDLKVWAVIVKVLMIVILLIKFKKRVREEIENNKVYYLLILSTMIIVIGAIVISLIEGISLSDALWWSFVTFTTVGYGDVLLKTQLGKATAVIIMFFGIGFIGVTTTALALYILNGGKQKERETYKEHVINDIKERLDNYEDLSNDDIDNIINILNTLKNKK